MAPFPCGSSRCRPQVARSCRPTILGSRSLFYPRTRSMDSMALRAFWPSPAERPLGQPIYSHNGLWGLAGSRFSRRWWWARQHRSLCTRARSTRRCQLRCLVSLIVLLNIGGNGTPTRGVWTGLLLVGLLWLGAKYSPLAACLGGLAAFQLAAAGRAALAGTTSILGLSYLWFHLQVYGGLTPYSVNLIYAGSSTPELIAQHVEIGNRLYRLLGLWVDREFGLLRWAPVFLLAVPGVVLARRDPGAMRWLLLPLGVQILVAAFLSITMRGWWFPGRMLIVVVPLLVPLVALGLSLAVRARAPAALAVILAAGTVSATSGLWSAVSSREVTLAVNPFDAGGWWLEGTRAIWPLYTVYTWETLVLSGIWIAVIAGLVWGTVRTKLVRSETRSVDIDGGSSP